MLKPDGIYLSRGFAEGTLCTSPVDLVGELVLVSPDLRDLPSGWLSPAVKGVITAVGGSSSHAVLQARAQGLPVLLVSVPELEPLLRASGARVALDSGDSYGPIVIPEGVRVLVNISDSSGWRAAARYAEGVGMWRSEDFLTQQPDQLLAVHADPAARSRLAEDVAEEICSLVGGHDPPAVATVRVPDVTPAHLGLPVSSRTSFRLSSRGLRLLLIESHLLGSFLRGVVLAIEQLGREKASCVRLHLPFVTSIEEIVEFRRIWASVCRDAKVSVDVPVGVAVEIPSLAWNPSALASVCDFASIGTNDFVQYGWAVDRDEGFVDVVQPYMQLGILSDDPFSSFAVSGLATPIKGIGDAFRSKTSRYRFGITGDMGRDPGLLRAAENLGIDYVSLPTWAALKVSRARENAPGPN